MRNEYRHAPVCEARVPFTVATGVQACCAAQGHLTKIGGACLAGASEVNRQPVHRHCGLANDLGQGRMSVHVHPEFLGGALDQLGEATFGDQLGDVGANCVHAEDEVGVGIGDDLEEAVRVSLDQRLADGAEREL